MAITSTSKPDAQDTAAYAASQPLFDSIRDAIAQLDEQKRNLGIAKDIVQQLHVKVPAEHLDANGLKPGDYTENLVEAWKSTTESFTRIFEQLCAITGPEPETGREAEISYPALKELHGSSSAARDVAAGHASQAADRKLKRKAEADEQAQDGLGITPRKKARSSSPASGQHPAKAAPSSTNSTVPSPGEGPEASRKRQRTSVEQKQEPDATVNGEQTSKRKRRRLSVKKKQKQSVPPNIQSSIPTTTTNGTNEPAVQYEDVSAEVDARLKAKEDAKKAQKEAKKRKRESLGSGIVEAEAGAEQEALAARDRKLKEKPAKKRSKAETGEAVRVDGTSDGADKAKGKRQGDVAEMEGRKKRKKAK